VNKLLVVGSYPPVPGAAAAATVAAVCRGWDEGREVEVVSPRPSAAHRTARLRGIRAARELAQLRQHAEAHEVVLSMERGMTFTPGGNSVRHRVEASALARALAGYSRVTVLMTSDIDVSGEALAILWPRVDRVVTVSREERDRLTSRLRVPARLISVDPDSRFAPALRWEPEDAVTPYGPPDWERSEQPRRIASLTARKVLGRHTDAVRARLVHLARTARGWRSAVPSAPGPSSDSG
jgi:hypothetical protein